MSLRSLLPPSLSLSLCVLSERYLKKRYPYLSKQGEKPTVEALMSLYSPLMAIYTVCNKVKTTTNKAKSAASLKQGIFYYKQGKKMPQISDKVKTTTSKVKSAIPPITA